MFLGIFLAVAATAAEKGEIDALSQQFRATSEATPQCSWLKRDKLTSVRLDKVELKVRVSKDRIQIQRYYGAEKSEHVYVFAANGAKLETRRYALQDNNEVLDERTSGVYSLTPTSKTLGFDQGVLDRFMKSTHRWMTGIQDRDNVYNTFQCTREVLNDLSEIDPSGA